MSTELRVPTDEWLEDFSRLATLEDVVAWLIERGASEGRIFAGNRIVFEVPGPGSYLVIPLPDGDGKPV